jgi:hypothetical protein
MGNCIRDQDIFAVLLHLFVQSIDPIDNDNSKIFYALVPVQQHKLYGLLKEALIIDSDLSEAAINRTRTIYAKGKNVNFIVDEILPRP